MTSDLLYIGNLPLLVRTTNNFNYDFNFRKYFDCSSILKPVSNPVLLRIGAIENYCDIQEDLRSKGMDLLVTKEEHERASLIDHWYPLIENYTAKTMVFHTFPDVEKIRDKFTFPIFVKGNRHTHHHRKSSSIIQNESEFSQLKESWSQDKYLHWQKIAIREFLELELIDSKTFPDMVPICYEFRFFFWRKKLVAFGPYWTMGNTYRMKDKDVDDALSLASTVANIIDVPFLSVDLAKKKDGEWVVIEVNDGQESGYARVEPLVLWNHILRLNQN